MKKTFKIVFGLAFIAAGLLWILNLAGVFDFCFSLDGWWAFFVIIPCFFGLVCGPDRVGSLIGLSIGVLLLLSARGVVAWSDFWQYALAALVIGIGIKMIFVRTICSCKAGNCRTITREGKDIKTLESNFAKHRLEYDGEKFEGIDVKVAFGGIEIRLPEGAVVKTSVNCSFAGISDDRRNVPKDGSPVIYITGKAAFGGIELK